MGLERMGVLVLEWIECGFWWDRKDGVVGMYGWIDGLGGVVLLMLVYMDG